jgi:hypothetical protein
MTVMSDSLYKWTKCEEKRDIICVMSVLAKGSVSGISVYLHKLHATEHNSIFHCILGSAFSRPKESN